METMRARAKGSLIVSVEVEEVNIVNLEVLRSRCDDTVLISIESSCFGILRMSDDHTTIDLCIAVLNIVAD